MTSVDCSLSLFNTGNFYANILASVDEEKVRRYGTAPQPDGLD